MKELEKEDIRKCAEIIKETLKIFGKEASDFDIGYLIGKAESKERGKDETKGTTD